MNMNIEAYNLDSLRRLVRELQIENKKLKAELEKNGIVCESKDLFENNMETLNAYDPDQGGRIISRYITQEMVKKYFPCFGEELMFMPNGVKMEVIFLSVTIDGMIAYVLSSREKK